MNIQDLPVEVLCLVFHFLQPIYPISTLRDAQQLKEQGAHSDSTVVTIMLGWINLTFVSRHWRETALADPQLWINIPFELGSQWANAFLERSCSSLINVTVPGCSHWEPPKPLAMWIRQFILEHHARTRSFTAYFDHRGPVRDKDPVFNHIRRASEHLDTLVLYRSWHNVGSTWLTVQQFPRLHSLTLGLSYANPSDFPWHEIATLRLEIFDLQFAQHPIAVSAFPEFLRALSQLNVLKILRFSCLMNDKRVQEHNPSCVCSSDLSSPALTKLEQLHLGFPSSTVFHILQHIRFPVSTALSLTLDPVFDEALFKSVFVPICSSVSALEPYRQLFLSGNMARWRSPWRLFAARSTTTSLEQAELKLDLYDESIVSALGALVANSQHTVQHLNVGFWPRMNEAVISQLFSLRKLSYIRVAPGDKLMKKRVESASEAFTTVLNQLLVPPASNAGSADLPFPELQVLDIRDVGLEMTTIGYSWEQVQPDPWILPTFAHALSDVLAARREAGGPYLRVYIAKALEQAFFNHIHGEELLAGIPGAQFLEAGANPWFALYREKVDEDTLPAFFYRVA